MASTTASRVDERATIDKTITRITNNDSEIHMQPTTSHQPTPDPATTSSTTQNSSKTTSRVSSLFLKLLHTDVRFMVYDQLVDQEHEVIISPHHAIHDHNPITALSATCKTISSEIENWASRRKDLTNNTTFGIFNPSLTTFKLCWFDSNSIKLTNARAKSEKYQRCYSPSAAALHINLLEVWQRAMTLTKSIEKDIINCAELSHPRLRNLHQIHGTAINQLQRLLSWNQHDEDGVKDFLVFDPKKWSGETKVTWEYRTEYSWQPYVWSSDWENHEKKQLYAFSHPEEGGKWVFGEEAEGTEATREGLGWWETFGYMAQRAEEIQEKIREAMYGGNEDIE